MLGVVRWVVIGLVAVVALIACIVALGVAWLMLGTFTILGVLLVLAGLGVLFLLKRFGVAGLLIVGGLILVGIEYVV